LLTVLVQSWNDSLRDHSRVRAVPLHISKDYDGNEMMVFSESCKSIVFVVQSRIGLKIIFVFVARLIVWITSCLHLSRCMLVLFQTLYLVVLSSCFSSMLFLRLLIQFIFSIWSSSCWSSLIHTKPLNLLFFIEMLFTFKYKIFF
jgi:hypothetical protein